MLSEEEKKAMDELQHFDCAYNREIKILLNLITKQSKEIEELKEKYSKKLIEFQKEREWYEKNYISKDKIKAKIEELKDYIEENSDEQGYWGDKKQEDIYEVIDILQSLLKKED